MISPQYLLCGGFFELKCYELTSLQRQQFFFVMWSLHGSPNSVQIEWIDENPEVMHGYNDEIVQCWRTNNLISLVWASITQSSGKDLSQGGSEVLIIGTTIVISIALCYYMTTYDYMSIRMYT